MKYLSRATLLPLLTAIMLSGCEKEKMLQARIELRVRGENLTGLGAEMSYTSLRDAYDQPQPGPSGQYSYAVRADTTYNLGDFNIDDTMEAHISLRNASCATTLRPDSWLRLETLANGVVIKRIELNAAARSWVSCAPYWTMSTTSSSGDWDD